MTPPATSDLLSVASPEAEKALARSQEILLPRRWLGHGRAFSVAVDAFMESEEHHLVEYKSHGGHRIGINRYLQEEDLVYSLISRHDRLTIPGVHKATSIIIGSDGRYYGEKHIFKEDMVGDESGSISFIPSRGIDHPLETEDWEGRIIPVTRALRNSLNLLKIIS